ncbi:MAG: leucine-rich repeat domain-containing protein, partial [Verrucomicrobia bacterium]|nr:leucine-rich repeat domain-containing protein [Verrucomicrobiota bacterium]
MSKPVSNGAIPNPNNASQGQMGEEQINSNAGIDSLPGLVLARIFEFAAADQDGFEATAAIRSTSREFRRVNDEVLLPELYYNIMTALRNHPFFQSIPAFQRIINANSDQLKSFQLFKDLSRVIGSHCLLFPEQYLRANQQLEDESLVAVWERIARSINFQNEPIPRDPQAIREWINNPDNNERIQNIVELNLSSMNLQVLPQEIGAFVNLQGLDLQGNCLASLPESFGNLQQLEWLNLERNQLASLPESLGNLGQLRELNLQNNQLASIPESLGKLGLLKQLRLEYNQLASLPESFGNLKQLEHLYLQNNKLASLPDTFGNLKQLVSLDLQNNKLASLSESFGNLGQLRTLHLSNNDLESLPVAIGNLQQLSSFYILNNRLKSLPETFGNLQLLGTLTLANNRLKDLPKSFGNLRSMRILDLSNNRLQGLPETFKNLQHQLEWLSFNGNLCLFMLDNKFSAFTSGMTKRILEKYGACQEYTPRTPLAKL